MSKRLTTEEFIDISRKIHGDKYDYSFVEYVGINTKVKIICPEHGIFEQKPTHHLRGQGCIKCGRIKIGNNTRKNVENFILESKEIHGDKYDYSLVEYINTDIKVKIVCPEHGVFEQRPTGHLSGNGCNKCSGHFMDKEYFIVKSNMIHGNKYDYSLVNYVNSQTKVIIICSIHGEFTQTPNTHLNGSGCPKCKGKNLTTKEYISKIKETHGDKYDYSLVEYINSQTKVKIICKEHGIFQQKPNHHLRGQGCPKCYGTIKMCDENFIIKSNKIHGNKYDYSLVNYFNNRHKVKIICPKHGIFQQKPTNHLNGQGCPKCGGRGIEYISFEECRNFVRKLGLKSWKEWVEYCHSGLKPENIPANPEKYYKKT